MPTNTRLVVELLIRLTGHKPGKKWVEAIGFDRGQVSLIKQGKRGVTLAALKKVEKAFGIEVAVEAFRAALADAEPESVPTTPKARGAEQIAARMKKRRGAAREEDASA